MINWTSLKLTCLSTDIFKKMEKQVTDWERGFCKYVSNKRLTSRIYEESL